jgi:hypothetical protein
MFPHAADEARAGEKQAGLEAPRASCCSPLHGGVRHPCSYMKAIVTSFLIRKLQRQVHAKTTWIKKIFRKPLSPRADALGRQPTAWGGCHCHWCDEMIRYWMYVCMYVPISGTLEVKQSTQRPGMWHFRETSSVDLRSAWDQSDRSPTSHHR